MASFVDISLDKNNPYYYDISFTGGDFTKVLGLDTAILISMMAERRASESEVKEPRQRRGWVGNEINGFDDFEYGTKLWLLDQSRAVQDTLNNAVTYTQNALQWLVLDNIVDSVVVDASYNSELQLIINIQFVRNNNVTLSRSFNLWENTFINGEI